jgi:hypothetical protein
VFAPAGYARQQTGWAHPGLQSEACAQEFGHIPSLATFGVTTHGVWTQRGDDDDHRLVALISYPDGADLAALTRDFMASPEFAADMEGFDPEDIVAVDSLVLEPTANQP